MAEQRTSTGVLVNKITVIFDAGGSIGSAIVKEFAAGAHRL